MSSPHRSYCHPDRFSTAPAISFAAAISSKPARSSTPARPSEQEIPSGLEIPGYALPNSRIHPARFLVTPLAFPWRFPNGWLHVYPERAGIPELEGGCHSSLGPSGDISISHSGVSCGHRNVANTLTYPLYDHARIFRTPWASQPDSPLIGSVSSDKIHFSLGSTKLRRSCASLYYTTLR